MPCAEQNPSEQELRSACSVFRLAGVLATLARFFKHGERAVMLPLAPSLWRRLWPLSGNATVAKNVLARKLLTKLAQRLALTLLDPTAVSAVVLATRAERHRGGGTDARTQVTNDHHTAKQAGKMPPAPGEARIDEDATAAHSDDDEVLALTEDGMAVVADVIDALLAALRDPDTVVRWSAAKGLGRIAARLPARCAADVIDALLRLFSDVEMDAAWQGASLALAEVVSRGLLPAPRLPEVRRGCAQSCRRTVVSSCARSCASSQRSALLKSVSDVICQAYHGSSSSHQLHAAQCAGGATGEQRAAVRGATGCTQCWQPRTRCRCVRLLGVCARLQARRHGGRAPRSHAPPADGGVLRPGSQLSARCGGSVPGERGAPRRGALSKRH